MKKTIAVMLAAVMLLGVLSACGASDSEKLMAQELDDSAETYEGTQIQLSDTEITVNGDAVHTDADAAVYVANDYSVLVLSSPHITAGDYTLWDGEEQLKGVASEGNMGFGGGRPDDMPEGMNPPEGMEPPTGERPDRPDSGDFQPPEGAAPPDRPDRNDMQTDGSNTSDTFTIREGANYFQIL